MHIACLPSHDEARGESSVLARRVNPVLCIIGVISGLRRPSLRLPEHPPASLLIGTRLIEMVCAASQYFLLLLFLHCRRHLVAFTLSLVQKTVDKLPHHLANTALQTADHLLSINARPCTCLCIQSLRSPQFHFHDSDEIELCDNH